MRAYLAIKHHADAANRPLIEMLCSLLAQRGIAATVMHRDHEAWGETHLPAQELMRRTFEEIDRSDIVIVEFSEKGVGIGIEAGYAHARRKPVLVIAQSGADISTTMRGIASAVVQYRDPAGLPAALDEALARTAGTRAPSAHHAPR